MCATSHSVPSVSTLLLLLPSGSSKLSRMLSPSSSLIAGPPYKKSLHPVSASPGSVVELGDSGGKERQGVGTS